MVAIISGTNRANSLAHRVGQYVEKQLNDLGEATISIDLSALPPAAIHAEMYEPGGAHPFVQAAAEELKQADRWLLVLPEYNGTYPGMIKLFLDAISVCGYLELFDQRKIAMIGTSTGRAGNLRGIDQMGAALLNMGCLIMPGGLPLSEIEKVFSEEGELVDVHVKKVLGEFVEQLEAF